MPATTGVHRDIHHVSTAIGIRVDSECRQVIRRKNVSVGLMHVAITRGAAARRRQLGVGCRRRRHLRREGGATAQPCAAGTWRGGSWHRRHRRRRCGRPYLPRAHEGTGILAVECVGGKDTEVGAAEATDAGQQLDVE